IASRLAQASAATSAAWRRFVKCFPQIPGELLRPRACTRSPYETDLTYDLGGKAVSKRHHAARSMAPGRARAGSGYLADGRGNGALFRSSTGHPTKSITMSVEGIFDVGRSPPTRTGADHGNAL